MRGLTVIMLSLVAGCGGSAPQPDAEPEPKAAAPLPDLIEARAKAGGTMAMRAEGVDLRLWDSRPSAGETRKPTFWVHAGVLIVSEDEDYTFENATAIVYGRDDGEGQITLEAGRGTFREDTMARLQGGVTAHVMAMTIALEDFEWNNEEQVGFTNNAIAITSPDSNMKASSLRLYPESKGMEMTDVIGTLRLGGNEQ